MKQAITERVQKAKNITEARSILKDYRLAISQLLQKKIQDGGSRTAIQALRDEQKEVDDALKETPAEDGAQ
jgi:hypothetical protein